MRRSLALYERASGKELSRLAVWIPSELHQALRVLATKHQVPLQAIVFTALDAHLRSKP